MENNTDRIKTALSIIMYKDKSSLLIFFITVLRDLNNKTFYIILMKINRL